MNLQHSDKIEDDGFLNMISRQGRVLYKGNSWK
jgi:hypothetical protein